MTRAHHKSEGLNPNDTLLSVMSFQINELEKKLSVDRRKIAAVCAKARNEYSKREIKKDFKAGLRVMS